MSLVSSEGADSNRKFSQGFTCSAMESHRRFSWLDAGRAAGMWLFGRNGTHRDRIVGGMG